MKKLSILLTITMLLSFAAGCSSEDTTDVTDSEVSIDIQDAEKAAGEENARGDEKDALPEGGGGTRPTPAEGMEGEDGEMLPPPEGMEGEDGERPGHPEGMEGEDGEMLPPPEGMEGQGHDHHGGESNEEYISTERIDLDGSQTYTDGTYTGTGTGYGGDITVEVTIEDNAITEIEITDHNETPGFYEDAFESLPSTIISSQTTDVDTIGGATRSSEGIILAVEDALAQAVE